MNLSSQLSRAGILQNCHLQGFHHFGFLTASLQHHIHSNVTLIPKASCKRCLA